MPKVEARKIGQARCSSPRDEAAGDCSRPGGLRSQGPVPASMSGTITSNRTARLATLAHMMPITP